MTARRPTLDEPIVIDRFWKNRKRSDALVTTLSTYERTYIIDLRVYFTNQEGQLRPSSKGIAMGVGRLVKLHTAIAKALERARELGPIDDGGSE
jgi:hypothetical protein